MDMTLVPYVGLGLFLLLAVIGLLHRPLALILRLLGNTALGFFALWLAQSTAAFTGIALGLNLWNALIIGILGLPGLVFLLLAQWTLV
ncbi:pro-sigmaK processing inhibitor BofA family protein [Bengtsoniella intestinalis]|uniref:pro-sigmaK processing inhibitor BofA family protein n=1 Tax=Bengtsoniella intestinalis TaxID=3073143 RepID=UPI00391EFC36